MNLLSKASFAGLALAGSLLAGPAHAGGSMPFPTPLPDGPNMPWNDGCDAAKANALAGKTSGTTCQMVGSTGLVDLSFDAWGIPNYATGIDDQNVGHHYASVGQLYGPSRDGSGRIWRGPTADYTQYYYESPAPDAFRSLHPPALALTDKVIGGRVYHLRGSVSSHRDPAERVFVSGQTLYVTTGKLTATYVDYCRFSFKSAESMGFYEAPGLGPLAHVSHFDDGHRNQQTTWNGTRQLAFTCGSYLPGPLPSQAFYAPMIARFSNAKVNADQMRATYAYFGGDYDRDPLGLFAIAHSRRIKLGSIRFADMTADQEYAMHEVGIAFAAAIASASATALTTWWTGPAVDAVATSAAFVFTFDATLVGEVWTDYANARHNAASPPPAPIIIVVQVPVPIAVPVPGWPGAPKTENEYDPNGTDMIDVAIDDESAASGVNSDGTADESGGADDGAGAYEGGGCATPDECSSSTANARRRGR